MPTATYRLQLRAEFTFHDAAAVVPYLADLGISHVYCSPVLQAAPGSAHGYDVIDHTRLSADLGGEDGWAELVAACRTHGLGIVVDIVPNHMAAPTPARLNPVLWDVLAHGRSSAYAHWFDIDWDADDGRLLVPVLGAPLEQELAGGEVQVDAEQRVVRYFDHEFPLAPGTSTLAEQHYRLAHWREASTALNYRRFFDVTTLMGLQVQLPDVFAASHRRILASVAAGEVDGLRIDHPDGLADPRLYLEDLATATGGTWTVVEKILEPGEELPETWRCAGTTGYDALATVSHLLVDAEGLASLTRIYAELTGAEPDFHKVEQDAKRQVVEQLFRPELDRVLREVRPPYDEGAARRALTELLVALDVYRAYADDPPSEKRLFAAVQRASATAPDVAEAIRWLAEHAAHEVRFEQTTGPVMAKGVEDTAFYRYHRLVALNEVGGDPGTSGLDVDGWHARCRRLVAAWPQSMTTLSTHDTKRSEDVRARLLAVSEVPSQWQDAVTRWRQLAQRHGPPDLTTDYLFWQILVATMSPTGQPIETDRMAAYLEKATREAKQHTSWTDPDPAYETGLRRYVDSVLADAALVNDVAQWVAAVLQAAGDSNTLAQKLLQLTMPGVPDVYQGQELPDRSLVDPDNRRPVDYNRCRRQLSALDGGGLVEPKLRVTATTLRLRRDRPHLFGGYEPVAVQGSAAGHVVAYRTGDGGEGALVVVTRLPSGLERRGGWGETSIELTSDYVDALTGRTATPRLAGLLADLPVALLVPGGG